MNRTLPETLKEKNKDKKNTIIADKAIRLPLKLSFRGPKGGENLPIQSRFLLPLVLEMTR
jgi:hypothetical protein